jgi:SRSO17 transposase
MASTTEAPPFDLSERDVATLAEALAEYHGHFKDLFFRREQTHWASKYLTGLLLPEAGKSAEEIAWHVPGGQVRDLQRFLGQGAWDDEALLAKHAELVAGSLGSPSGVLIVDGSDFPKQGKHSVGVARQYCGATGKVDNCQAGVFLAYATGQGHTLLDRRLYLPEQWLSPAWQGLRDKCGVLEGTAFKTKPQLAWDMIKQVQAQGLLPFTWVACDEAFGDNPGFLEQLESAQINYLAEVSVSTRVWLQRPATGLPPATATGRPPSRERLLPGAAGPQRVDEIAGQLPAKAWRRRRIKDGEKGVQVARFAFLRAVAVRDKLPGPEVWLVFRRSANEAGELKVFISNAAAGTPQRELVRVSGLRWPIETCFKQAKGNLGMDEYQTRSWRGWHHHMTLVILAHHFLVRLKLRHKKGHRRLPSSKSACC